MVRIVLALAATGEGSNIVTRSMVDMPKVLFELASEWAVKNGGSGLFG